MQLARDKSVGINLSYLVFLFIGGPGVGIASTSTPMYIAEIKPKSLRGRMARFPDGRMVLRSA